MIIYSSKWVWLLTVATPPAAEGLQAVQQPIMTCPLAAHDLQGSHRNHTDGAQYLIPLDAIPGRTTVCMNMETSNEHFPSFSGPMKAFSKYIITS